MSPPVTESVAAEGDGSSDCNQEEFPAVPTNRCPNLLLSFPSEVLLEVFRHIREPGFLTTLVDRDRGGLSRREWKEERIDVFERVLPFRATKVCQRWRDIARSASFLWSCWHLNLYNPDKFILSLLQRFFRRSLKWSGDALLSFTLEFEHHGDSARGAISRAVSLLTTEQRRWEDVSISLIGIEENRGTTLTLNPATASSLKRLDVEFIPFAFLNENNQFEKPCFRNLRKMSIIWESEVTNAQENLCRVADTLEDLSVKFVRCRLKLDVRIPHISMPSLRHLKLDQFCAGEDTATLMHSIVCPSLETLVLKFATMKAIDSAKELLKRSNAPLASLSLVLEGKPFRAGEDEDTVIKEYTVDDIENSIMECLRCTPMLRFLELDASCFPDRTWSSKRNHDSHSLLPAGLSLRSGMTFTIAPRLSTLCVSGGVTFVSPFMDLFKLRWHQEDKRISIQPIQMSFRRGDTESDLICNGSIGDTNSLNRIESVLLRYGQNHCEMRVD